MWDKVGDILQSGGVVIIPSDSSYGMAALASSQKGVEKLYKIKGREGGKPSLVIVGSIDQAKELALFTPLAEKLVKEHWPGGLTVVLEVKDRSLSPLIYGQDSQTLAVRLPNKKELVDLASKVGPFILPSANFAGEPAPFLSSEIDPKLAAEVDFVLSEPTNGAAISTLVDARGEDPVILRQGSVILVAKS
jgi:L-threonylcarbamoyladenylate synthase